MDDDVWAATVDCVWRRLLSLEFLVTCAGDDPVAVLTPLSSVCKVLRAELQRLWATLARPYLGTVPLTLAARELAFEVHERRLLASAVARLAAVGVCDVCVTDEYAAWHLERALDTALGRDGLPRTVRGTHVWSGRTMHRLWFPSAIEIHLHAADVALAVDIVAECFRDFVTRVDSDHARVFQLTEHGDDDDDDDGESASIISSVVDVARHHGLSEQFVPG